MEDSNKPKRGKSKQIVPVRVLFCGAMLEGVSINGINYVAMKPIVEGMGLDWEKQLSRMQSHPVLKDEVSPIRGVPSAGGPQTMMCLPETRLQFWMAIINPLKVKASIYDKVVTYQKEAAENRTKEREAKEAAFYKRGPVVVSELKTNEGTLQTIEIPVKDYSPAVKVCVLFVANNCGGQTMTCSEPTSKDLD